MNQQICGVLGTASCKLCYELKNVALTTSLQRPLEFLSNPCLHGPWGCTRIWWKAKDRLRGRVISKNASNHALILVHCFLGTHGKLAEQVTVRERPVGSSADVAF